MSGIFEYLRDYLSLTPREELHIAIAGVFLGGAILSLLILMLSRLTKSHRSGVQSKCQDAYQSIFNELLAAEPGDQDTTSRCIDAFELAAGRSLLKRQILLDHLVHYRKNLSGEVGERVLVVFREMDLSKISMRKLNSLAWQIKAKGIRDGRHSQTDEDVER